MNDEGLIEYNMCNIKYILIFYITVYCKFKRVQINYEHKGLILCYRTLLRSFQYIMVPLEVEIYKTRGLNRIKPRQCY